MISQYSSFHGIKFIHEVHQSHIENQEVHKLKAQLKLLFKSSIFSLLVENKPIKVLIKLESSTGLSIFCSSFNSLLAHNRESKYKYGEHSLSQVVGVQVAQQIKEPLS